MHSSHDKVEVEEVNGPSGEYICARCLLCTCCYEQGELDHECDVRGT